MSNEFRNAFSGFGQELLDGVRASVQRRSDDATFEERVIGIENATSAMLELNVEEDKIIQMLQKYWDLRLSEAKMFIERQKSEEYC
jgi:hypothetical protein